VAAPPSTADTVRRSRRDAVLPLALPLSDPDLPHLGLRLGVRCSGSSATAMTTSAMKITTSTLDLRHIAHRQCTSP
jgi:hypothetical protein